jgi:hypothetical protein
MKTIKTAVILIIVNIILTGQIKAQSKIRSWKTNEDFDPNFKKMVVIGMIERMSLRSEMEENIVIQARKNNLYANMGYLLFPPEIGNPFENMDKVRNGLLDKEYDALLSVAIFGTSAKRYIPPERVYVPIAYYNRFGSYYRNSYAVVRRPGYMTTEDQYFIECNLYNLQDGKLLWSGRTYAFPQTSLNSQVSKFAHRLFKALKKQEIVVSK